MGYCSQCDQCSLQYKKTQHRSMVHGPSGPLTQPGSSVDLRGYRPQATGHSHTGHSGLAWILALFIFFFCMLGWLPGSHLIEGSQLFEGRCVCSHTEPSQPIHPSQLLAIPWFSFPIMGSIQRMNSHEIFKYLPKYLMQSWNYQFTIYQETLKMLCKYHINSC